jgi:MFS family permease
VVAVLWVAYVLSFLDRQILSLLVEPIKRDLVLNDTQVSLLQGLAFAVFNAVGGLPLGRWVDTGRRVRIVSVGVAFWSLMTALCGRAGSFGVLLVCRMGVGIGEASLTPAAYSIIADSVPPHRVGLALGVFTIGVQVGSGLAFLWGASMLAGHSWRDVFLFLGLPGVVVAAWALTLREPTRRGVELGRVPVAAVMRYLRANARSFGAVYLCMAFAAMAHYAVNAWMVSTLIRTFGWTAPMAGRAFGPIVIASGALGILAGGVLGDWVVARGRGNGRLLIMSCAAGAAAPFAGVAPLANTPGMLLGLMAVMIFFTTMVIGIGPATLPELAPNRMRGVAASIGVLIVNLLGLGLGPTTIALMSDYGLHDERLVRYSLATLLPCMLVLSAVAGFSGLRVYGRRTEVLD